MRERRRAVLVLPSMFTLANLFFGFWAIVSASRGNLERAAWLVVLSGIADWLDGRVAYVAGGESRFGQELDSLVDLVSFGVAPSLIVYFRFFAAAELAWLLCALFVAAMAMRLARFNVEQAGLAKRYFLGLPSPAAGGLLATAVPFTQSSVFAHFVAGWKWDLIGPVALVGAAALMVSRVPYPAMRPGIRGTQKRISLAVLLLAAVLLVVDPSSSAFPLLAVYVAWGLVRALGHGLADRLIARETMEEELGEPVAGEDEAELE